MKTHIKRLGIPILLVIIFNGGCTPSETQSASLINNIGWLHGNCLAIKNSNLPPKSVLTIIELDDPQKVINAQIIRRASNSDECYALLDDRKEVNVEQGNYFYVVSASKPINLGIGVIHSNREEEESKSKVLDIDNDGVEDTFYFCSTSEGIQFSIWKDVPYKSKELWSDYYYLGYDVEANCPMEPNN